MAESARDRLLTRTCEFFAEHGIADTSLRTIAAGVGTSHRMLHHHFGSREGLLRAVVERLEQQQRDALTALTEDAAIDPAEDLAELSWRFWLMVGDAALTFGPLFYELSAHAMQGRPHAESLRRSLIEDWIDPLAAFWLRYGFSHADSRRHARLDLAVARGLLQDLLLTGDRESVDNAMRDYLTVITTTWVPQLTPRRSATPIEDLPDGPAQAGD